MKILKWVVPMLILLLFPVHSYPATLGSLRVSLIEGDIQIKTEDTDDWVPASINMPLREGDRVWVPEGGRTELQLRDGTLLRLGEQSALEILTLQNDSSQFYLTEGHVYANFRGLRENLLQIDTQVSSVRAYDRSIFRVDVSQGYLDISVFTGSAYAETKDGTTRVAENKTLSLGEGDYAELSPLGASDEWENGTDQGIENMLNRDPLPVICLMNCLPIPATLNKTEGGHTRRNMVISGDLPSLFPQDGLLTESAGGYGWVAIMSGSLMNDGVGHLITMEDGLLLPQ